MKVGNIILIIILCSGLLFSTYSLYKLLYNTPMEDEFGVIKGEIIDKKIEENEGIHYFIQLQKDFNGRNKTTWTEVNKKQYYGFKIGDYYGKWEMNDKFKKGERIVYKKENVLIFQVDEKYYYLKFQNGEIKIIRKSILENILNKKNKRRE